MILDLITGEASKEAETRPGSIQLVETLFVNAVLFFEVLTRIFAWIFGESPFHDALVVTPISIGVACVHSSQMMTTD